jgi:hypothetical protein
MFPVLSRRVEPRCSKEPYEEMFLLLYRMIAQERAREEAETPQLVKKLEKNKKQINMWDACPFCSITTRIETSTFQLQGY